MNEPTILLIIGLVTMTIALIPYFVMKSEFFLEISSLTKHDWLVVFIKIFGR